MSYSALYRRLRPQKFAEMVGQEHIVRTLTSQIKNGMVSHAYLFCGTHGTGKTTIARIFAKAVNCLNAPDGEPCRLCAACLAIEDGRSLNIIEFDAASNTGVEYMREIREEVKYPPVEGKYKTYIIDEAHMLSQSSFNALLKTLEEPPPGIIFILATTDPAKIPATIHSRCQRFDFRRIKAGEMRGAVEGYLNAEGIGFEPDAVEYAVSVSDGSMRDALSLIDQCASFYFGDKITLERVLEITGSVDISVFFRLANALFSRNTAECLGIIDEIINNGRDVGQFVAEFTAHLRNMLIALVTPQTARELLDYSQEKVAVFLDKSRGVEPEKLMIYLSAFSELAGKLKYAQNPRILVEITCISLLDTEKAPVQAKTDAADKGKTEDITQMLKNDINFDISYK